MQKLKVGDTVQVMKGAERSASKRRGKVLRIDREANRLRVEGLRMIKRHVKKGRDNNMPDGGIIETPGSIALADVKVVCPKCDAATRIGIRIEGEGEARKKHRFCKKCQVNID